MSWPYLLTLLSFTVCLGACIYHIIRLISAGKPLDYSIPAGNVKEGIVYSFTGGMSPAKKESAYLHLPTYVAGLLYHLGTFVSFGLLFFILTGTEFPMTLNYLLSGFLFITAVCGTGIFIKRLYNPNLKALSNADDYISNLLVTAFQAATAIQLHSPFTVYFLVSSLLFLYLPLGKLKHVVYFFAARYQLGFFFGWRGVWPPKN